MVQGLATDRAPDLGVPTDLAEVMDRRKAITAAGLIVALLRWAPDTAQAPARFLPSLRRAV